MYTWSLKYDYNVETVRLYAPVTAGVYVLAYQHGLAASIFYVGQSDDLERRLLEHLYISEVDTCIRTTVRNRNCYFQFMNVPLQIERNRIEQELIARLSPACNN